MKMDGMRIELENFRVFRKLEWMPPRDVVLVVGPNGSGKSTLLSAFWFLRTLFYRGHEAALGAIGSEHLRRHGTSEEDPVCIAVELGDISWRLKFPMSVSGIRSNYGEELFHRNMRVLHAEMYKDEWHLGNTRMTHDDTRCCARVLWDRGDAPWLKPLYDVFNNLRVYSSFWLNQVRHPEIASLQERFLHTNGKNLWSVLSNWKASPIRYRGQFEWVMKEARKAFPGVLETIEFDRGLPYLFAPKTIDPADASPPARESDGLLTGLLQLTAIAGAGHGAFLAFDEIENRLHPHAIRSVLAAFRSQAEEKDLTVVLTSHSPVVMNEFKGRESEFFAVDRENNVPIRALNEVHDSDWLEHFSLGDLYDRERIGAPRLGTTNAD